MYKIFLIPIFLFGLLLGSCNNKPKSTTETNSFKDTTNLILKQEKENFDIFFNQFQRDSVFQKDRIIFPLKNLSYNTDTESFNERLINEKEWKFTDFSKLPESYLKRVTKLSNDEYNYNIQIEDTGVSVNYIFKIHNNKWHLVEIKDEST